MKLSCRPAACARWGLVAASLLCAGLCALFSPAARGDNKKDKPEKEKKEKVYTWTEVRNDHFVVTTDGGEALSRHVLEQFEQLRQVFATILPDAHLDTGIPVYVLASKDSDGFAAMLPEYPVQKRRPQPYGLYFEGAEKTYVAMRLNTTGMPSYADPYSDIYQQYARMILRQSYHNLPPWLEDGYLSVFSAMGLTAKGAKIDRPDPDDMSVLFESPLLPLNIVLQADRKSPYASGDRHTVYYAEAHALAHYLVSQSGAGGGRQLAQYLTLTEGGANPLEAARQSFGDLNQLQSNLEAYIKQTAPRGATEIQPDSAPSVGDVTTHTLTAPEAEARFADCELSRGRLDDARAKLEEATMMQASMAEGEESLGFVLLKQQDYTDAEQHLSEATKADPRDALAFYGLGLVSLAQAADIGVPVSAINAFEKSVALNPSYAPAWTNLAQIYANNPQTLQKALDAAQHAVSLAPGDGGNQYLLAEILQDLGRNDDARKIATQLRNSSDDTRIADRAGDLLARDATPRSPAPALGNPSSNTAASNAPVLKNETTNSTNTISTSSPPPPPPTTLSPPPPTTLSAPGDQTVRLERKTNPADDAARTSAPRPVSESEAPPTAPVAPPPISTRVYSMLGTIAETTCATAKEILLTLKAQTITMHLHAADFSQLSIKPASGATASGKAVSCVGLRGRNARVSYQLVQGQKWDGEIQSIELRNEE